MVKYNKKNRAIVSGILVGVASIFAVASHFDVEMSELTSTMLTTLTLFVLIVALAAITLLCIKAIGMLFKRGNKEPTNKAPANDKEPQ